MSEQHSNSSKPSKQRFSRRFVTAVGIVTAALSLFYPLREGYFYFHTKQQQRNELDSYINVASLFEQQDSLSYAKVALSKALTLAPNDIELQRRLYILTAEDLLREIDWSGSSPEQQTAIEAMVLDGYRLINTNLSNTKQAQLLVMLGRLLPYDRLWNDVSSVSSLYQQAIDLKPHDAEIMFRQGQWLIAAELDYKEGIRLIEAAVISAPNDALYAYELAVLLLNAGDYQQALTHLRNTINLSASQRELQRVRSANLAKTQLKTLLVKAHQQHDITSQEFIGLGIEERRLLIEKVLSYSQNDRSVNRLAAQFYLANDSTELAQVAIEKVVRFEDLYQVGRGYYLQEFTLYRDILKRSGNDSETRQAIEQALDNYQQSLSYDESLEVGIEGKHRYKTGLRVAKENDIPGLLILKAYSGYPFAKAGVVAGDTLLQIAHRRPISLTAIHNVLSSFEPGASIPILVNRDGSDIELELEVE